MTNQFIAANLQEAIYSKKEGTATSYSWKSGAQILPKTLSIGKEHEFSRVARKGRNLQHPIAGQVIGRFTLKEESPLKQYKPYKIRTQIWSIDEYPLFIGYGSIAISNTDGKITKDSDFGDLIVLHSSDDWQTIHFFYFAGMVANLYEVMDFLTNKII